MARKLRSEEVLGAEGVPVNAHLPLIEDEAESLRRSTAEVAARAVALCMVAVKGEGLEHPEVLAAVDRFGARPGFTPDERRFIDDPAPSEHHRIQFTWQYECYWVMLWALGLVPELGRPDRICDVPRAVKLLADRGRAAFEAASELRPQAALLDAADLIYRYHWAIRDARLNGQPVPAGLEPGVVMERHRALNWLIGYAGQDWDEITTDT